ncbi:MAG: hypothetical protein HRU01_18090, partial [Myxococcales bacterium]|nr:hypothetical protein [Myxococcales bacterium]
IVDRGGEVFRVVPDGVESQCAQAVPTFPPWATALTALGIVLIAALFDIPETLWDDLFAGRRVLDA